MNKILKFTLLGGDMRHARLAALLSADGHTVCTCFLDKAPGIPGAAALPLYSALDGTDCVIFPLPATDGGRFLNAPLSAEKPEFAPLLRLIPSGIPVFGGRLSRSFYDASGALGLTIYDYYEREEMKTANAEATAEGAIQIAMEETPFTLCGANVLVIGFGRIGKFLSHMLRGIGANVTVSARKARDWALIRGYGCRAADTFRLESELPEADIIFNTVPAIVLTEERLALVKKDAVCIDLASKPGGTDFEAASKLGVKIIWALSLPGEVAPESSGAAIKSTVYNLLSETGVI